MGEIKIVMPDDLEMAFRKAAMKRFGFRKGAMSEAAKEAIELWSENDEEGHEEKDPIEAISGLMKNVKESSVELQHRAWSHITKNHIKKVKKNAYR